MQDAGARRLSNADGVRRMVRKHDCALPAQYTKHSNARGHSLRLGLGVGLHVFARGSVRVSNTGIQEWRIIS